jgi:hypothetical protein
LQVKVVNVVPVESQVAWHWSPAAYFWQAPPPSHQPLVPQVATPWSRQRPSGSACPDLTAEQVPSDPLTAQDMHRPWQPPPQHTPCSQKFDVHSLGEEQDWPLPFVPQEPLTHRLGGWHCEPAVEQPV